MKKALLLAVLVSGTAQAFIPPLSEILIDLFAGRKGTEAMELTFRHEVMLKENENVEVIEQFVGNRSGGVIRWQLAGQPDASSDWTSKEYVFRNGKAIPSRTGAFIDVFLAESSGELMERLIRERFMRRDQLLQFKPGYTPAGDPKTWDTKGNYLLHDDVFLTKTGREFGVAVVGLAEAEQRRMVVFSKNGRGVQKLEWTVGPETASWEFSGFSPIPGIGRLPRVMALQINGVERVKSTLASARPVKRDAVATARLASKQPSASNPPSSTLEEVVRLIVRYR